MLANGIGVEKDLEQALMYSRKASAGGVREASAQINNIQRQISLEKAQQGGESGRADVDAVYVNVQEMPQYPGGNNVLLEYLRANIKYPAICRENRIQGRVLVSFIINKDGSIEAPRVVRGVHEALDYEALRVISEMPVWEPGRLNGEPVRVMYTIPVNFRLN
jgi:TonB family protein